MKPLIGLLLSLGLGLTVIPTLAQASCTQSHQHHCPRIKHHEVNVNYGYPIVYCEYLADPITGAPYEVCHERSSTTAKTNYYYHMGCESAHGNNRS